MDQTLQTFLELALSPVGAGLTTWGAVAFIIKLVPALATNSDAKFWLAMLFAFLVPSAALALKVAMGLDHFGPETIFLAVGIGYMVSQGVHRGTEALQQSQSTT